MEKESLPADHIPENAQETPLVTVETVTYNHAGFIRQCIEGVLMQKTSFPFEYIIGEDCSTDNTREICQEYAQKYPERIKLITSESNVGSRQNHERTSRAARGKYIAVCEGDDYWTDPEKLQKQVDFLEQHPDYTMCCHASRIIVEGDESKTEIYHAADSDRTFTVEDFLEPVSKNFIRTESVVLRKDVLRSFPDWIRKMAVGDYPLFLLLAYHGKIWYIDQVMSVYRKHPGGIWSPYSKTPAFLERYYLSTIEMYRNFDKYSNHQYHRQIQKRIPYRYYQLLQNTLSDETTCRSYFRKYWTKLPLPMLADIFGKLYLQPFQKKVLKRLTGRP